MSINGSNLKIIVVSLLQSLCKKRHDRLCFKLLIVYPDSRSLNFKKFSTSLL